MMRGLEDQDKKDDSHRGVSGTVRTENEVTDGVSRRTLTLLDRLRLCQDAWAPGGPWDRDGAHAALWGRPAGSFLVLRDSASQPVLLCVVTGGESGHVRDNPIQRTGAAYQLSQSFLGFSDLAQLVAFYSMSRDVLPVCLFIPPWLYSLTDQPQSNSLSQLGPKSWLCPTSDLQPDHMTQRATGTAMCTIQLTAANGALCIINPLYLHEHGDDWLTHQPTSPQRVNRPANYRRERRLSTTRPWSGAGLLTKRAISMEQESYSSRSDNPGSPVVQATPSPPTPTGGVVLRRPSRDASIESLDRTWTQDRTTNPRPPSDPKPLFSPAPQSPHRVSWVEDRVWLSKPPPPSLLRPPSLEMDSLSISSMEEEPESVTSPSHSPHPSHRLADKVKHRLSAVGLAIGGLGCPQKRMTKRVQELSKRRGGLFAEAVMGFVEMTLGVGFSPGMTGADLLQEVRTALTALRETLLDCPEIHILIDSMADTPDGELDAILELSLHKVALKPVSAHLYTCLQSCWDHDGSLRKLRENQRLLEGRGVEELEGTPGAGVPDPVTLEKIQQRWSAMHQSYSPSRKVHILLKVCKTIYHSMTANANPGVVYGADDFLPCLTWVLLRSDVVTLQLDTNYMMELLDPTQLQGEGGYYLTSLYASLFYISSFRPRLATRQLSTEAQQSLSQWHRRRTLHCNQSRRSTNRRTLRRPGHSEKLCYAETETGTGTVTDALPAPSSVVAKALHIISEVVVAEEEGSRAEGQGSPAAQLQEKEITVEELDGHPAGSEVDLEGGVRPWRCVVEGLESEEGQASLHRVHEELCARSVELDDQTDTQIGQQRSEWTGLPLGD
ncbi:ras and Rab interactor 2 isoform X1 [Salvelinus alpinus]|uniref:ras and Rab interactor 2 isoform X1 n=2 Tax=Salvelinus alpinus TaxID=8036 RepID=UPI0039FC42AA